MLDSIINKLKEELISSNKIETSQAEDIAREAGASAKEVMRKRIEHEGVNTVMQLFSDKPNSPKEEDLKTEVEGNFLTRLTDKLGIPTDKAMSIVSIVVPKLMSLITKKNNETDANDSSDLVDMFTKKKDGLLGSLGGMFG